MSCCVNDHKPRHASDLCWEVAFRDIIFHLSIGEVAITLDDVSCLMHLPIKGSLLDNERIEKEEVVDMMVTYLDDNHGKAAKEEAHTRGAHARFNFAKYL